MLVLPATFLQSRENRGCCGEGNSQHVAAEGEICTADNISACSFYLLIYLFIYFLLFMSIFTFSKQSFNESLDFCNRS